MPQEIKDLLLATFGFVSLMALIVVPILVFGPDRSSSDDRPGSTGSDVVVESHLFMPPTGGGLAQGTSPNQGMP